MFDQKDNVVMEREAEDSEFASISEAVSLYTSSKGYIDGYLKEQKKIRKKFEETEEYRKLQKLKQMKKELQEQIADQEDLFNTILSEDEDFKMYQEEIDREKPDYEKSRAFILSYAENAKCVAVGQQVSMDGLFIQKKATVKVEINGKKV